jgi:hypothetical protein
LTMSLRKALGSGFAAPRQTPDCCPPSRSRDGSDGSGSALGAAVARRSVDSMHQASEALSVGRAADQIYTSEIGVDNC